MTAMLDRFQIDDLLREAWRRSPRAHTRMLAESGLTLATGKPPRVTRTTAAQRSDAVTARAVLAAVRAGDRYGMRFTEIADACEGANVGVQLARLVAKGSLVKVRRGLYAMGVG